MTIDTPQPTSRTVERLIAGRQTADGAGVKLTRVLTQDLQRRLDPFLMLDAFRSDTPSDYLGGFPDHPHRGFETVTYMIAGRMRHRDSAGNEGLLGPGGAQWMVAGSGLIHSEFPEQAEGRMEGFQLWLNLPAKNKMTPPSYRDIPANEIPLWTGASGEVVRVIAGAFLGVTGAVQRPDTEPVLLDIELPANTALAVPLPPGFHAFLYTFRGQVAVADESVPDQRMAILSDEGAGVALSAAVPSRALLVAGRPLGEPIVQHGPFVMKTAEEIEQTVRDYRAGRFALIPAARS